MKGHPLDSAADTGVATIRRTTAAQNGADASAGSRYQRRRLGARAAANRALRLTSAGGRQEAVRRVAGRVQTILENASARAMDDELKAHGDVSAGLVPPVRATYNPL